MTKSEKNAEHRHIYETRLGILGLEAKDTPTAEQHNLAVAEADKHMADLKLQQTQDALAPLIALRESL